MAKDTIEKLTANWNDQFQQMTRQIFDMVPQNQLNNLSRDLISQNGLNYQISMCMEEISELVTELVRDTSFEETAGEIADVFITLNHVTYGYKIRSEVNSQRNIKIQDPKFMAGNDAKLIALLGLQKELLKHMNRKKDNLPDVINFTADSYVALAKLIIARNNLPIVRETVYQKIRRTIQRSK